jgi:GTP-binding protein
VKELSPKLFAQNCEFIAGVATLEQMPEMAPLPEIAFCGRSNVGKSSLLNALLARKHLARTSGTPGHTRQLNFFNLADTAMLVDVPGYGYAKAPKTEIKRWTKLLFSYLRGRPQLLRALVLIDARQGVMKADEEMMKQLDDAAVSYQLVLTKRDKLKPDALEEVRAKAEKVAAKHPAAHPVVLATSSETREGIEGLQDELLAALHSYRQG